MTVHLVCPQGHLVQVALDKIGSTVTCPTCFTPFCAELDVGAIHHARKDDKRSRRARDEDEDDDDEEEDEDDEEEDERPKKKPKSSKAKDDDDERVSEKPLKKTKKPPVDDDDEDDDEDKPRKKKGAPSKAKDDEDDEEVDEDDGDAGPDEEEEEPIEWTPRKKRLNMCGIGLMVMMGAYCVLIAFTFFLMLVLDFFTFAFGAYVSNFNSLEGLPVGDASTWLFAFTSAPFAILVQIVLVVGLFMNLPIPPRAEAKGSLIAGIVFGGLVFLCGILILLALTKVIVSDDARAANLSSLLGGGAALCFLISLMSAMAYHGTLLRFLNLRMEASQPITNTMFYVMYFFGMFTLFALNPYACYYLHPLMAYVFILAIDALAAMAIRMLIAQVQLFLKSRRAIMQYIRDA